MNTLMVRLRQHPNGTWYVHYTRTNRKSLQTKDKALAGTARNLVPEGLSPGLPEIASGI